MQLDSSSKVVLPVVSYWKICLLNWVFAQLRATAPLPPAPLPPAPCPPASYAYVAIVTWKIGTVAKVQFFGI